jgi:hypothetical protein
MRVLITMLVCLFLEGCSVRESPKPANSQQIKITTNDPNLPVDLVASWGNQKEFFIREGLEILEWDAAKSELLKGNYQGGKQYHTGWVIILMNDGRKYLTKPPGINTFFEFMKKSKLNTKGFAPE